MNILLLALWAMLSILVNYVVKLSYGISIFENSLSIRDVIEKKGFWATFFFICIRIPIIEEASFRLWLSFKRTHLLIGVFFFLYLITGLINPLKLVCRIAIIIGGLVLFYSFLRQKTDEYLKGFNKKHFKYVNFMSIFIFSFLHITNFTPLNREIWFVYLFLIIPQIIAGYYLVKVRLELGFVWSVGVHIFNNMISFLINSL